MEARYPQKRRGLGSPNCIDTLPPEGQNCVLFQRHSSPEGTVTVFRPSLRPSFPGLAKTDLHFGQ